MAILTGTVNPDQIYGTIDGDSLSGLEADDLIYGFDGNDILNGGAGDDILYGGSGDDTFHGGAGEDLIFGQSGNDLMSYGLASGAVVLDLSFPGLSAGDAAGDVFTGVERFRLSKFNDVFSGSAAADYAEGDAGNDTLWGHDGADQLFGGAGDDLLIGGAGADLLHGGTGFDVVSYADAADVLRLDLIDMTTSSAEVAGDIFIGIEGFRLGNAGDQALATNTATRFWGGDGDDTLWGGNGADTLEGEAGTDELWGGGGGDLLIAGDEADHEQRLLLEPWATGGRLYGGGGDDTLLGGNMPDSLSGDAGNDVLSGGDHADTLSGGSGNDLLSGGAGDDWLTGGAGADTLQGGDGRDVVVYDTRVTFDATDPSLSSGDAKGDLLETVERIEFAAEASRYLGGSLSVEVAFLVAGGLARPGAAAETVIGNHLDTVVDYAAATAAVRLTGDASGLSGGAGAAFGDRIEGAATLITGRYADVLTLSGAVPGLAGVTTGGGRDRLVLDGADIGLFGGNGNDTVTGSLAQTAARVLELGAGNDRVELTSDIATHRLTVLGGAGADTILLGHGNALVDGGEGADVITVTGSDLQVTGGGGNDLITATLIRAAGITPHLSGGSGNDTITASLSADAYAGPPTQLLIEGGAGNDLMTGTSALLSPDLQDRFIFGPGWGQDTIAGFDSGTDLLVFSGVTGLTGFADLTINTIAGGIVVSFGTAEITLLGLLPGDLDSGDILLI